eukprot:gnl/TRDRNA2_/TRDRNA2_177114_c0_seq11.p1 gnl/TRDRNA2_/TRDRNA2_177114_c0~~gnl/TRDRNA2_/TRDRNA2_177114_c0_seq11.p1  ORF type:complete len:345 (-),score=31.74 gnl/TRDRNA2_/TRDRNA2_177114_c0_seq11:70-1104(-)
MSKISAIMLVASITLVRSMEQVARQDTSSQDSVTSRMIDKSVDQVLGKEQHQPSAGSLLQHADLDSTTVGKTAHLAATPSIPCPRHGCRGISNIPSRATPFGLPSQKRFRPGAAATVLEDVVQPVDRPGAAATFLEDVVEPVDRLNGAQIEIKKQKVGDRLIELAFHATGVRRNLHLNGKTTTMQLHWAALGKGGAWELPSNPPSNADFSQSGDAMRTTLSEDGHANLTFASDHSPEKIAFVLYVHSNDGTKATHWLKAPGGNDFTVDLVDEREAPEPHARGGALRALGVYLRLSRPAEEEEGELPQNGVQKQQLQRDQHLALAQLQKQKQRRAGGEAAGIEIN